MAITNLISVDDFRKVVGKVDSERDQIAIKLLFGTGCRVEELVGTKLEDVDTVKGEIHIHASRTKTRQYRDVIIPQSMIPELEGWIESLPEGSMWLFPGRDPSKHISQRWVRMVIDRAARQAGIQRSYVLQGLPIDSKGLLQYKMNISEAISETKSVYGDHSWISHGEI